jgi:hypothetical protein
MAGEVGPAAQLALQMRLHLRRLRVPQRHVGRRVEHAEDRRGNPGGSGSPSHAQSAKFGSAVSATVATSLYATSIPRVASGGNQ